MTELLTQFQTKGTDTVTELKAEIFRLRLRLETISQVASPGSAASSLAWDALQDKSKP